MSIVPDIFQTDSMPGCWLYNDLARISVVDENGVFSEVNACKVDLGQNMEYFNVILFKKPVEPVNGLYKIDIHCDMFPEYIQKFCEIRLPGKVKLLIDTL